MSNPQQETKVELVTEAIEALVLATVVAHTSATPNIHHADVADARANVSFALRALLQPVLRVVTSEKIDEVHGVASTTLRKTKTEVVPYQGKGIEGMNLA